MEQAEKGNAPPLWAGLKFFNVYGPNEYHKGHMASVLAKVFDGAKAGKPLVTETIFAADEGPRADTSAEALAKLKPAFAAQGTVTAGNSSQTSDGAAAAVIFPKCFRKAFRTISRSRVSLASLSEVACGDISVCVSSRSLAVKRFPSHMITARLT